MDDRRFDDLARAVAGTPSRRGLVRALAGAVASGLLAVVGRGDEALAAGCRNDGDCRPCHRCNRKQGEKRGRCVSTCRDGQICCGGRCGRPGPTCCTNTEHCGPERGCMSCWVDAGRCEPKPDGRECGECKRCKAGACTESDPDLLCEGVCCGEGKACTDDGCCPITRECSSLFGRTCCPEGERCTQEDGCCPQARACGNGPGARAVECCDEGEQCVEGACCPEERACDGYCCPEGHRCDRRTGICCQTCGDACCGIGHACVDGGIFGDTFCCDAALNRPCGDNGDGTFAACCSDANEECCDGECVPKDTCRRCVPGERPCGDTCCPESAPCCNGRCCVGGTCCNGRCVLDGQLCCEQPEDVCQESGKEWCCNGPSLCCGQISEGYGPACCPPDYPACVDDLRGERACCKSFQDRVNCVAPSSAG